MKTNRVAIVSDRKLIAFWCEGCRELHCAWPKTSPNPTTGASWTWNGDLELPTLQPSVLVESVIEAGRMMRPRCHSFIVEGKIRYLSDCEHELAGKTLDLLTDPLSR